MECHECGETISDKAADCPHCGTSVRSITDDVGVGKPSHDDDSGDVTDVDGVGSDPGSPAADDDFLSPDDHDESPATRPTQPMDSDSPTEGVDGLTDEPSDSEGETGDPLAGEEPLSGDQSATGDPGDDGEATGDEFSGGPTGTDSAHTGTVGRAPTGTGGGTSTSTSGDAPTGTGDQTTPGDREETAGAGGQTQQVAPGGHDEESGFDAEEFVESVELVVLDSATGFYRLQRTEQDEGEALRAVGRQLAHLLSLARKHDVAVAFTNQVFTDPDGDRSKGLGGHTLNHWSATVVRVERFRGGNRRATLEKHRARPAGESVRFQITGQGLESGEPP
jgi:DNA repair protein RadB